MSSQKTEAICVRCMAIMIIGAIVLLVLITIGFKFFPNDDVAKLDPARLHLSGEFAEDNLGAKRNEDGSITLTIIAARYGFFPSKLEIPSNTPIKIRLTSADVLHSIHSPFTDLNAAIIPGEVAEINTVFTKTGDYPLTCNEFCGLGHDNMRSTLTVYQKGSR